MTDTTTDAPEPFDFSREYDGSLTVEAAVFQAIGAASVCWERMSGTGLFDDARATAIGRALLAKIAIGDEGPDPERAR